MANHNYPKDPEEMILEFIENVKRKFSGRRKPGPFATKWIVGILALVWLASGFTIIQPYEEGVMFTFGKIAKRATSGPKWHWPRPIGKTIKVPVTRVQKIEVGFRTVDIGPPARYQTIPTEALMLTGDENIVHLEFIVQYKIKDPEAYLINLKNPRDALRDASEAGMREVIGKSLIDLALTEGKSNIQVEAEKLIQSYMNTYKAGLVIDTVKLQDVTPPEQVNDAFKDVINAKQDKERKINEAKGFKNDIIPAARGEAAQQINQAQAYKQSRITEAEGVASRFRSLLSEYRKGKVVTKTRLYLETMEEILPSMEKTILSPGVGKNAVPYLPLAKRKGDAQ